ncbi:MAG: hypothetical protein HY907_15895 [Deltaproteobacteria bacterium]|nr:hypothetical protein [Deltaproteobacteria bacterium]
MSLGPVLPQLQPHDWPGLPHASCRKLFPSQGGQEEPWVSLFYPVSPLAAFVGSRRLEKLGQTREDVEREAIANLAAKTLAWRPANLEKPGGGLLGVLKLDDFFAAECILCAEHMRRAEAIFPKGEVLVVGIPRRGSLLAVPGPQARDGAFRGIVRSAFEAAPRDFALTPSLFVMKRGRLLGRLN